MGPKSKLAWITEYQNAACAMFLGDPPERLDYPGRSDLLVGYTVVPELWRRAQSAGPCRVDDLARGGETFCYVKLDGADGLTGSSFADREDIEEALDEVLAREALGCVIGAGTGRRYSYVDLALADVGAGYAAVCRVLRAGRIPRRTWVLPFGAGAPVMRVWDDTPPAPT
jgi:hypothetical protein